MGHIENRQQGVQAGRAIAALCIMYFHSPTALARFHPDAIGKIPVLSEYGYLSIDLFFAISGYVICMIATKPGFNSADFLVKRAFRIYPLWLSSLGLFAVLALAWRHPTETETISNFLVSATLAPTQGFPFYNPGWTLQHEMVFYLIAALVLPIGGVPWLVTTLLVSSVAAYTIELPWYLSQFAMRHSDFLAGILAYLLAPKLKQVGVVLPLTAGLCLMTVLVRYVGEHFNAPALFLLLIALANYESPPKALTALGDASYSIYLLHLIMFLVVSAFTSKIVMPSWSAEAVRIFAMGGVCFASMLCYRYFERPLINYGRRQSRVDAHDQSFK